MVDRDPRDIEPYLLTPDYWDGHAFDDECDPYQRDRSRGLSLRQSASTTRFAKSLLTDFLAVPNRTPVRVFNNGEVFLEDQFPDGTIVEVNREFLYSGSSSPYHAGRRLGVVLRYRERTGKEFATIAHFNSELLERNQAADVPLFSNTPVSHFSLPITVGEVTHKKPKDNREGNSILRVNQITVYEVGKRAPQEARRRLPVPRLGVVFRPQHGKA